jgi:hypothetical protein
MWESIDKSQQTKHNLTWLASRFMRSRLDNILQQNRTTADRHILGEIPSGEFISGRNARPAPYTSLSERCQSSIKSRSGKLPWAATTKQKSARAILAHS